MGQFYFDPKRTDDPYALPDGEAFFAEAGDWFDEKDEPCAAGWYWRACFPGCIPDSEPFGPFESEAGAIADAQEAAS
jgi:hypothetical protein